MKILTILLCLLAPAAHAQYTVTRYDYQVEDYEQQAAPAQGTIAVTGNSNIRGWPSMQDALKPLPVYNRGFGGSTIEELDYYLDRLILVNKPRAVVIHEGENDFAIGYTPARIASKHAEVIVRLHAQNKAMRVYVIGLKPSPRRESMWPTFQQTNTLLAEMCKQNQPCLYIPPPACLLDSSGKPIASLFKPDPDRLHLTPEAYLSCWNPSIAPVIVKAEADALQTQPKPPTDVKVDL